MRWVVVSVMAVCLSGCMFFVRPPIERGLRVTNDRFEVVRLNGRQLSEDQRLILKESGTPKYIVFENELSTGKPVQRWIYPKDKLSYVFLSGKKVDYVVVESTGKNPLLEAAQGERGPLLIAWEWFQLIGHWIRD